MAGEAPVVDIIIAHAPILFMAAAAVVAAEPSALFGPDALANSRQPALEINNA